jgi:hypothetical protein
MPLERKTRNHGDRGAALADRDDCCLAELYHRRPKRSVDLVIDQCHILHGEWRVERCGSNQRHLERQPKRQRDCELRSGLHWSGRNRERHSGFECGGGGCQRLGRQERRRRCDGAVGVGGVVHIGCGRATAAGSCASIMI